MYFEFIFILEIIPFWPIDGRLAGSPCIVEHRSEAVVGGRQRESEEGVRGETHGARGAGLSLRARATTLRGSEFYLAVSLRFSLYFFLSHALDPSFTRFLRSVHVLLDPLSLYARFSRIPLRSSFLVLPFCGLSPLTTTLSFPLSYRPPGSLQLLSFYQRRPGSFSDTPPTQPALASLSRSSLPPSTLLHRDSRIGSRSASSVLSVQVSVCMCVRAPLFLASVYAPRPGSSCSTFPWPLFLSRSFPVIQLFFFLTIFLSLFLSLSHFYRVAPPLQL